MWYNIININKGDDNMRFKNYSERELAKKIKMCERSSEAYIDVIKTALFVLMAKDSVNSQKDLKHLLMTY